MPTRTSAARKVEIKVPCSTSNLGPGFDAIGLALRLYNTFTFERLSHGLEITIEGEGAGQLETDSGNRTFRSYAAVFNALRLAPYPVHIHQNNEIPLARGLGGSATAVLAGVIAALVLLGKEPKVDDVLGYSTLIENHPDNLTPSMVGGLTVSLWEPGRIAYVRLDPPEEITSVVLIPDFRLETGEARKVLPSQVPLADAVTNLRGSAMIMAAVAAGEIDKLALAMRDRLHQPYRAALLPGMHDIFRAALEAGSPAWL
jgi:homoserine kinase